jgi:hypothetical protein
VPPRESDPAKERERRRILNDRLRDVDADVLAELLRWWRKNGRHNTCRSAKKTIADELGISVRTVQYSFRRLEVRGFIRQFKLRTPDPDDPGNKTGWRIALLFLPALGLKLGQGPDRRPPEERRVWTRNDGGGRQPVASPLPPAADPAASAPTQPVATQAEQPVASKERAGVSNRPDGAERDDDAPSALVAAEPSSSSRCASGEEKTPAIEPEPDAPELVELIAKAEAEWGPGMGGKVREAVHKKGLVVAAAAVEEVVEKARRKKRPIDWGYVWAILNGSGPKPQPLRQVLTPDQAADQAAEAKRQERAADRAPDPQLPPASDEDIARYLRQAQDPRHPAANSAREALTKLAGAGDAGAIAALAELKRNPRPHPPPAEADAAPARAPRRPALRELSARRDAAAKPPDHEG